MNRLYVRITGWAIVSCLLTSTWSAAQDNATQNQVTPVKESDRSTLLGMISPQENDARIVRWLIPDQQAMIECCKMAQDRASSENVKLFAQKMVTEHNSCLEMLQNIRKERTADGEKPTIVQVEKSVVDLKKSGVLVRDTDGKLRDGKTFYQPTDFVKVKEDICDEMKSIVAKAMKDMTGSEFERAFIIHLVAGHEAILASCKAVRKTASKDLQLVLDRNIDKLNGHLKEARQLCDQVCGKATTKTQDTNEANKQNK